jgi:cyclopropane fatty-acyl-phospholipid synthase-like methyltransferase
MSHRVCPWWLGFVLASPLRRLMQAPGAIVGPHLRAGMRVLEPGPGMGFFTLEMARRVGAAGRVIAVDIQPKMLASLRRRATRAGLEGRIETRLAGEASLKVEDLAGSVDFALAFAMVHELPDSAAFFREVAAALRPGGTLLLAEPAGHVSAADFERELAQAAAAGLAVADHLGIKRSLSALLRK